MKTIKARVESAILDDKSTGIFIIYTDVTNKAIDCETSKEEQDGVFVPLEAWGKISSDKSPRIELQKIADLLSGIKKNRGMIEEISDWKPKILNIEIDS